MVEQGAWEKYLSRKPEDSDDLVLSQALQFMNGADAARNVIKLCKSVSSGRDSSMSLFCLWLVLFRLAENARLLKDSKTTKGHRNPEDLLGMSKVRSYWAECTDVDKSHDLKAAFRIRDKVVAHSSADVARALVREQKKVLVDTPVQVVHAHDSQISRSYPWVEALAIREFSQLAGVETPEDFQSKCDSLQDLLVKQLEILDHVIVQLVDPIGVESRPT